MPTIEEYRERLIQQKKSLNNRIDAIAAQVGENSQNIEYNAEAIEEIASIVGGDE
jgi:hypothetical protein